MYDPRREERRQRARLPVPDDVQPRDLDPEVRQDLRSLSKDSADLVARHLVMTGRLLDDDPQQALLHARAAGALGGRVGAVREAVGLAAYAAEEWAEALSELRAARRITGRADHLPVMADSERALGRPERALAQLDDPDVPRLEQAVRVELVIVVSGARRDLGQPDAAVLLLQGPARATTARRPWAARLWYAYADALLAADRGDEAREWFAKAAEHDGQGETDAMERLLELDGVVLEDLQLSEDDDEDDQPYDGPEDLSSLLGGIVPGGTAASGPADEGDTDPAPVENDLSGMDREVSVPDSPEAADGHDDVRSERSTAAGAEEPSSATAPEPLGEQARSAPVGSAFSVPFAGAVEEPVEAPRRTAAVPGVAFVVAEQPENPGAAPEDDDRDDDRDHDQDDDGPGTDRT